MLKEVRSYKKEGDAEILRREIMMRIRARSGAKTGKGKLEVRGTRLWLRNFPEVL